MTEEINKKGDNNDEGGTEKMDKEKKQPRKKDVNKQDSTDEEKDVNEANDNDTPKKKVKKQTIKPKEDFSENENEEQNSDQDEDEKKEYTANKKNSKEKNRNKKRQSENEEQEEYEECDNAEEDEVSVRRKKRSVPIDEEDNHDVEAAADQETKKSANTLASKKSVAQGMMDIALITANANQLRYMVEFNQHSSTFYINIVLIVISLILQLSMGIILIYKTWLYMQGKSKTPAAKSLNIYVTAGVFCITIINVFIASFTVMGPPAPAAESKS